MATTATYQGSSFSRPYVPAAVQRRQRRNRRIGLALYGLAALFVGIAAHVATLSIGAAIAFAASIGGVASFTLGSKALNAR